MICKLAAIAAAFLAATTAVQAQGSIPQPVIDQCNDTARASDLPDCLKEGTIGFEMLEIARTDDFYGDDATPVIEACTSKNETFQTTWICFREAAADAVETRELVGRDNISDRCVANISDPELVEQLDEINRDKRTERFPDEMFSGVNSYYSFDGCSEPAAEDEEEGATGPDTPSGAAPDGTAKVELDGAACSALGEVETFVADSSADELRALGAELNAMEDPGPEQVIESLGFSAEASDYLLKGGEDHGMIVATILGAFIDEHHPGLLLEFFELHQASASETSDMPSQMGDEFARGFLMMIIDTARERYDASCHG